MSPHEKVVQRKRAAKSTTQDSPLNMELYIPSHSHPVGSFTEAEADKATLPLPSRNVLSTAEEENAIRARFMAFVSTASMEDIKKLPIPGPALIPNGPCEREDGSAEHKSEPGSKSDTVE
jgi:hypothetical protein